MDNEVHTIILPRTEDLVKWCAWLVPVIFSLLWDVWKAWKRRALWIPGQALVLSALIIQLLSFIDDSHISVYSGSSYQKKEVVAVLVKNQLVIDSGRVMMCVLIAYLLPGMARSGSTTVGMEVAALVLSITFNILSEVQSVWKVEKRNESLSAPAPDYNVETKGSDRIWSKVCSTTLFVATIYLLVLLIQAARFGRSIRRIMSQKITSALSCCCTTWDRPRCCTTWDRPRRCKTKDHVLKCWMVARVSQPDYVLARSGLCSMAWVSVTVCIVVSVTKWRYVHLTNYESLNSGNKRTLTQFVIVGQLVIILIGWIVVYIREVNFVCVLGNISNIEYFWRRSIEDAQNDLNAYLIRLLVRDKRIRDIRERHVLNLAYWLQKLRVLNLAYWLQKLRVLDPEHWLQKLSVRLSKLNVHFFQKIFMWVVYDNVQFSKHKESLEMLLIPGESAESLWIANQWGFRKVERCVDQGQEDGKPSPSELISLLRLTRNLFLINRTKTRLQQANKNSWKRTAVSLIHFMIYFYDGSDDSVIEDAMQCYIQAWEYMNFVDGLNEEVKSLDWQTDEEFESLQHSWDNRAELTMLKTKIKDPLEELIDQLISRSDEERRNLQNSWDSTKVAKYCLFGTWTVMEGSFSIPATDKIHRLQCILANNCLCETRRDIGAPELNKIRLLQRVLANVYFFYMTEDLNEAVLQKCSKLAEEGMEEEILHVAFLSAKAQGVLDKLREGHNTGQASTSSHIPTVYEQAGKGDRRSELGPAEVPDEVAEES